jgi:hypothetical protein
MRGAGREPAPRMKRRIRMLRIARVFLRGGIAAILPRLPLLRALAENANQSLDVSAVAARKVCSRRNVSLGRRKRWSLI